MSTRRDAPPRSGRGTWAVGLALLLFAGLIFGLVALTIQEADDLLATYFPLREGQAARYRITYANGVQGWVSFNQVHPDENYSAPILSAGGQPFQQDSVWANAQGVEGLIQYRTDVFSRTGDLVAETALRLGGAPATLQPPLPLLSASFLQQHPASAKPLHGMAHLPNGVTIELTRTLLGREGVTVPAGSFEHALKLQDELRTDETRQLNILWLAPGQGLVRGETLAADGTTAEVWELVRANYGPAAQAQAGKRLAAASPLPAAGITADSGQGPARLHRAISSEPVEALRPWWTHRNRAGVGGSAVGGEGLIYYIDYNGVVTAQEARSGAVRWRFATGNASGATPTLADGVLYVGSGDKHFYALDAASGHFLWSFATLDAIVAAPVVTGERVYLASGDRTLYALEATTGQLVWEYRATGALQASPALAEGTLLIADTSGAIIALDPATGVTRWQVAVGAGVTAAPALNQGQALVAARDFNLYALNLSDGQTRWTFETRGLVVGGVAVGPDLVYLADDAGWVYAVERNDGIARWTSVLEKGHAVGAPLLLGDGLIVATQQGQVVVLDAASGRPRGSYEAEDEAFLSTPWWDEATDLLVLPGTSGYVYALAPNLPAGRSLAMRTLWEGSLEGLTQAAPALAGDTVYYATTDGTLAAFDAVTGHARTLTAELGPLLHASPRVEVGGRRAFVGNLLGQVMAVDLESGAIIWTTPVGDAVQFDVALDRDSVFVHALVGERGGQLTRLDMADGAVIWRTELDGPGSAAPIVWQDRVVAAAAQVYSLDRTTGRVLWAAPFGPVTGALAVGPDGTVYASDGLRWVALDATDGRVLWQVGGDAPAAIWPPAVDQANGVLVIGLADGLHGLDLESGQERWRFPTEWPAWNGIVVQDGVAYATADNGQLYAVSTADGTLRTNFWPGGTSVGAETPPIVSGNRLYFVQGLSVYGLEIVR